MGRRARQEITEAELDELLAHSPSADLATPAIAVEVVEEKFKTLTEAEERQREELEASVEQAFYVAGAALKTLRERRLYRSTHQTFESYCRDRFGHSRQKAHFLIAAAGIYQRLLTNGCQILPANERQIRPLALLEPNRQVLAWQQAVSEAGGKIPSGRLVRRIIQEIQPPTDRPYFKPNEVCQILVKENPALSGKHKCWGLIRQVEEASCWVACWDGQYPIPLEHLQLLDYSPAQRQTLAQLEQRLRRFQDEAVVVEAIAYGILEKLGKLERPELTALEERLLEMLEQEYGMT